MSELNHFELPPEEDQLNEGSLSDKRKGWIIAAVVFIVLILAAIAVGALVKSGIFSKEEEPATSQAFITIVQPIPEAVLSVPQPVQISGMGGGLIEGKVVVQALDAGGYVLAQEATTINASDAGSGGEGPWSVQMVIPVKPGTTGQIYAFSASPVNGSDTASTYVAVTFGRSVEANTYIEISEPSSNSVLNATPFTVSGSGGGLFEGTVVVQALDAVGNVLAEQPTMINAPNAGLGEAGPWSVQLSVTIEPGTIGKIYAFSASPADGSIMASSFVNVTYGEGVAVESFIEIAEPKNGTVIPGNPVTVIGIGAGLFEGNVVVQALDNNNNVLAEKATIIDSPDAGVGGQGPWTVQLHVTVKPGTPGKIYAFSPSPKDGSVNASSQVDVIFGEVDTGEEDVELEDHLWILERYGGEEVLAGTRITAEFKDSQVTGTAGCNNYFASYVQTDSRLEVGPIGATRMMCSDPEGIMEQESGYLALLESANTFQIEAGQLKVQNASGKTALIYEAAVTGTVTYMQRIPLPEDAVVEVKLLDISIADAEAVTISEQTIANPGQVPIPFELLYDPQDIDPRNTYSVQVRITNGAEDLIFINTSAFLVLTQGNPSTVEVIVEPVE
ncbi:Gmad2 immunoglobulin-like domain-containing protein [Chloroflexota bacterium]